MVHQVNSRNNIEIASTIDICSNNTVFSAEKSFILHKMWCTYTHTDCNFVMYLKCTFVIIFIV